MRKYCIILIFAMLLFGCGKTSGIDHYDNEASSQTPAAEKAKEIYWETTEDLGLSEESDVRLESNEDGSDLTLVIDESSIVLKDKDLVYENPDYTKIIKNDFDKDGIMEVVLLFYGGSGGTYQNFRVIKQDGQKWDVVPMDFTGEDNESLVDVTLNDESVKLCVDATGYEKTVKIPKKYMSEEGKTETAGTADRFFELQNNMIVLAYRIYVDTAGNSIGDVRQEIQFDESGNRLVYGKTSYMTATEAEKRPYELCE